MATALQKPTPNPSPDANINPTPEPNSTRTLYPNSLSFDEVSKFFSSPLADAADSLGVCTSVLKRICYDNGLDRWPYRKLLFGKTIEEIKEDAAEAKKIVSAQLPKGPSERSDAISNSTQASSLVQIQNKSTNSIDEITKSRVEHPVNKNSQTGSPQKSPITNSAKETLSGSDEFKYGFPSNGLSTVSCKWWGSSNDENKGGQANDGDLRKEQQCQDSSCGDSVSVLNNGKDSENTEERSIEDLQTTPLSLLRKRAATEGREALELGSNQGYGTDKLDHTKRMVLRQIFKTSLADYWKDESS